jgi:hypothetical protein
MSVQNKKFDIPSKIENTIMDYYDDLVIKDTLRDIRKYYNIIPRLNKEILKKINKIKDIDKLVECLTESWIEQSLKDPKVKYVISKKIIEQRLLKNNENKIIGQNRFNEMVEELSRGNFDFYLKQQLTNYRLSDLFLFSNMRVNMRVWGRVIDAMLLGAPEENIIKCNLSIYEKYYLPQIATGTDSIEIIVHEHTTQKEFLNFWGEFKKERDTLKNKFLNINSERKRDDYKLDRLIWDYYEQGIKPKIIAVKLEKHDYKDFKPKKVSERLKEIKKRIRWIQKNKRF